MDRLDQYRAYIRQILEEYRQYRPSYGEVELELIIDVAGDHYQLMSIGWQNGWRIHGSVVHIDIRNGKIWIQHDGTAEGVTNRLVELGVPKSDIVIGFHSPFKRQFTEFAVG
jgi:hypothetical protein